MKTKELIKVLKTNLYFSFMKFLLVICPNQKIKEKINNKKMYAFMQKAINRLKCKTGKYTYCHKTLRVNSSLTTIGNFCSIGQNVTIGPSKHPTQFLSTSPYFYVKGFGWNKNVEFNSLEPCHIGNDVWIGGSVVVCPGVTIGDNTVIGAGSVVTKDIPSGVVAAGNPCRVIRPITQEENDYWKEQFAQAKALWDGE